jgi:hypothetical protein
MRTKACLLALGLILGAAGSASGTFSQGFETDTAGWTGVTRVPSLTHGVPSSNQLLALERNGRCLP